MERRDIIDMRNRVEMTLDEQKSVMLNILIKFSEFCDRHNLEYFIDAGTLLGAVRHKGYIPWDDDIDVNMPRKDYDQFCELVKQSNYYMETHMLVELPETTIYPFMKISDDRTILIEFPDRNPMEVRVYIDVFPKDGIVDLGRKSKALCMLSQYINLLHWFNTFSIYAWKNSSNFSHRVIAALGRRIIKHPNLPLYLQQKLISVHNKRHPLNECQYVTTLVNGEFHKCAPKNCFESYIMMDFEGKKFKGPIGYDEYLKCLYPGDYMQLPPIEKQIKHHNANSYWISQEEKEKFLGGEI